MTDYLRAIENPSQPPVFLPVIELETGTDLDGIHYSGFYGVKDPVGLTAGSYVIEVTRGAAAGVTIAKQVATNIATGAELVRTNVPYSGWSSWTTRGSGGGGGGGGGSVTYLTDDNTVLYVSATGDDATGDGSSAKPYKTVNKAWKVLCTQYNMAGHFAQIKLKGAGTFRGLNTGGNLNTGEEDENETINFVPQGGGYITITGDVNDPKSYIIGADDWSGSCLATGGNMGDTVVKFEGVSFDPSGSVVTFLSGDAFLVFDHIKLVGDSPYGFLRSFTKCYLEISHFEMDTTGTCGGPFFDLNGGHVKLTTPTFTALNLGDNPLVKIVGPGYFDYTPPGLGDPGTFTGKKFSIDGPGYVKSGNHLPGSITGTVTNGGQPTPA